MRSFLLAMMMAAAAFAPATRDYTVPAGGGYAFVPHAELVPAEAPAAGFIPTPVAAYVNPNGSAWTPMTAGAGTPLSYVPNAVGLYCQPSGATAWSPCTGTGGGGGGGTGTVTNVSTSNPGANPFFTTSVTNPTTTPSIVFALVQQAANCFFAGPSSGAAAVPTCRAIVPGDIPALPYDAAGAATTAQTNAQNSSLQKSSNLSDLPSASQARTNLGLGSAAQQNSSAFDAAGAAAAAQTAAQTYSSNASNISSGTLPHAQLPALVSADIPNNAASTTGSAGTITGTLPGSQVGSGVNGNNITTGTVPSAQLPLATNSVAGVSTTQAVTTAQSTANQALSQSNASAAGGFSLNDPTNLLALYTFRETSGSVLNDVSGASPANNGTINTSPSLTGTGYYFSNSNQSVDLPTSVNNANTFYFAIYAPPATGGYVTNIGGNAVPVSFLVTNGTAGTPFKINGYGPSASSIFYPTNTTATGVYSLGINASGALGFNNTEAVYDIFSAFHVIAVTCPSGSAAVFYLDGKRLQTSGTFNCYNAIAGTASNFRIGGNPNLFWPGAITYFEMALYKSVHTDAQVASNSAALRQAAVNKGAVTAANQPYFYPNPTNVFGGDSILCGYTITGSTVSCGVATTDSRSMPSVIGSYLNNATYANVNLGMPYASIETQIAEVPQVVTPYCSAGVGQSNYIQEGLTNQFNAGSYGVISNATVFSKFAALAQMVNVTGCRGIFMTAPSRTGTWGGSTSFDTALQSYAAYLRSSWKTTRMSAIVDLGTDPLLGCTGCNSNTTYFYTDGLHLTVAGEAEEAKAVAAVINGLDGYNSTNMSTSTLSSPSPITLTVAQGGNYMNPDTNSQAQAVTMFSAMWMTGREVKYCNVGTTYNVVMTSPSDAGFNNAAAGNTQTITPGTCLTLRARFNENPAVPGGFWQTF